ncbi:YaiI/YqxD family protein [Clostridiaceae bacterium M8S5]|nr:YaiI/YqxD family protein [Clostridiaceae bacterium M8S5]
MILYVNEVIKLRVLVDADACPVKKEIVDIAKKFDIKVIMYIDTSHVLNDGYSEVVTVGQGKDAVDIVLVNNIEKGDIVVTGDYGVGAMALSKQAFAIDQNGRVYTTENIDRLLFERHIALESRKNKQKFKKHKKRQKENNEKFKEVFKRICQENINKRI